MQGIKPYLLGVVLPAMSPISAHLSRSASGRLGRFSRSISSISHLTEAERRLYVEYLDANSQLRAQLPPHRISQGPPAPQFLRPQIHDTQSSSWIALENIFQEGLERGRVLKVVSWNIECFSPGQAARAFAALDHLKGLFGEEPDHLVVMLQEVRRESLQVIMENSWVQRNFVLSNIDPPESIYTDIEGDSFILRELDWEAHQYFTLIITSRHLAITNCFRVPFVTDMGRDALVVDIPVSSPGRRTQPKEFFRLCTTHLESLWEGKAYRPGQLALISTLLRGAPTTDSRIIAGLVGGDMNAIDKSEHLFHKASDVDLKDVWEDMPAPPIPVLKPFQKDLSFGQARGNTWGYQSNGSRERKRMDKFLYTGSMETVAIHGVQDITGRLGRLGIGLKTEVEAWEYEFQGLKKLSRKRGGYVEVPLKRYHSETSVARLQEKGLFKEGKYVRTKLNHWVSDHFAIAVGIKVL